MHAIGDRAIAQAISAVESLAEEELRFPPPGPRIEHAEMLEAASIERGARAGLLFSMQPNFTARWQGTGALYEQILGEARARALNPFREVAACGRLVFGSDTMPLDPLLGLCGAAGHPLPGQRLPLVEAVRHYTASPASAAPRPFGGGRLATGEPADFVVLRIPGGIRGTPFEFVRATGRAPGPVSGEESPFDPAARATVAATWMDGVLRYADAAFQSLLDGVAA
jgi:predicted amidohydrolase YtcJ